VRRKLLVALLAGGAVTVLGASPAFAQGGIKAAEVQAVLDNIWILVAAVLVFFMHIGFTLVETGLTRAKNAAAIVMKNLMTLIIGVLAFGVIGFTLAFGGGSDWLGYQGWFLDPGYFDFGNLTIPTYFIFQAAFAATAATIVSGAMAERTKFISYMIFAAILTGIIYPIVAHWVWGGGWLSKLDTPFIDFAGSTVVHSTGAWAALMGVWFLGPRIGKYGPDGKPRAILGHSIPFAIIGVLVLFFGWFGFNGGSQLAADFEVGRIALTTAFAGVAGGMGALIVVWLTTGKPDVGMTGNGILGGLVGITAGCSAVNNWGAVIIGALAGTLVVFAVLYFDRVAKLDDPVGAISVHGACGVFGTLMVGFFATEGGLFYGGGVDQLVSQLIGIVAVLAFVVVTTAIVFFVIKATIGLRVGPEEEMEGLDVLEHGAPGYAGDTVTVGASFAAE